jgi:hypothetical protein
LLVTARFKELYEREGLTGITEFSPPVEIVRAGQVRVENGQLQGRDVAVPTYHAAEVFWGGGNIDDVASGVVYEDESRILCDYCRDGGIKLTFARLVLEPGSWTGLDMFIPRGTHHIFVTERFVSLAQKHELKNAFLVPSEQYARSTFGM